MTVPQEQTIRQLPVEDLALDPENPRLPEGLVSASESTILKWLESNLVLEELAESMVENGFFQNEPLVVLPQNSNGKYVVVEGNRRFATLAILLQLPIAQEADVSLSLRTPPELAQLDRLREVPCLVVAKRDDVRQFLGFRHIGGLKTWSPEAKARYLASEIERETKNGARDPFREVARKVGSTRPAVRDQYVALRLLQAARDDYDVPTNFVINERFGVWNRLLNSPHVRTHIGLVDRNVAENVDAAVEQLNVAGLREVIGDLTPPAGSRTAVLNDSRGATLYGEILANPRAHATLRRTSNLTIAAQVIMRGSLADRVRELHQLLTTLVEGIDEYDVDQDAVRAVNGLAGTARTLRATVVERGNDDD